MNILQLRRHAGQEEVDYLLLKSLLSNLAAPRDKISHFLKKKELIRIKKGLYVFGREVSQTPFSKTLLANLIYGPSAISLEYALSFYGMIPERVEVITCITNKRNKHFSTPVGEFDYRYMTSKKYAIGITLHPINANRHILIATPEKALADTLLFSLLKNKIKTHQQLEHYLLEDQRIDETLLHTLNIPLLKSIAEIYKSPLVTLLAEYLQK